MGIHQGGQIFLMVMAPIEVKGAAYCMMGNLLTYNGQVFSLLLISQPLSEATEETLV